MTLDSVKYTLPNGREAVALVDLETFVVARPISGRSPSTGTPFIAISFVSTGFSAEQTTEQWQDLKGKLTALSARGRNNLGGLPPLPDPVITQPPARDPGDPFLDSETAADLSATVSRAFSGGLAEAIRSLDPGETVAYSAVPSPVPVREMPGGGDSRIRAAGIGTAPGGGS